MKFLQKEFRVEKALDLDSNHTGSQLKNKTELSIINLVLEEKKGSLSPFSLVQTPHFRDEEIQTKGG